MTRLAGVPQLHRCGLPRASRRRSAAGRDGSVRQADEKGGGTPRARRGPRTKHEVEAPAHLADEVGQSWVISPAAPRRRSSARRQCFRGVGSTHTEHTDRRVFTMTRTRNQRGFTLVEILIVVII